MKTVTLTTRLAILGLLVGILGSCSITGPRNGSLRIPFPDSVVGAFSRTVSSAQSRAIANAPLGYVRVYLQAQGGLIPIAGSTTFEAAIPADKTLEIDSLPVLRDCRLFLALSVNGGTDFRAATYATSDLFNIVAGATTDVGLTPQQSPFLDMRAAPDPQGVKSVALNGSLYFYSGGRLNADNPDGSLRASLPLIGVNGITAVSALGAGKVETGSTTHGFDFAQDQLWVCADNGIWSIEDLGTSLAIGSLIAFDPENSSYAVQSVGGMSSVSSATFDYKATDGSTTSVEAVYYQGPGRLGGAVSVDNGTTWNWFDIGNHLADLPSMILDAMKNSSKGMIADFAVDQTGQYAYLVVPGINTFRIGGDMINTVQAGSSDPLATANTALKNNTIVAPAVSGIVPMITSIAKIDGGTKLYVGTDLGAFIASVDSSGMAGSLQPIDLGRIGISIVKLRTQVVNGIEWTAILSRSGNLYLLANGTLKASYPFYSGLPDFADNARVTGDIYWTAAGDLVVTGANGAVLLPKAKLP